VKRSILLVILLGAAFLATVLPAAAVRSLENYPKVLTYSSGMNELPAATQDSLSWYDVIVCMDRPETIASLRARNPNQRYIWQIQPQYVEGYSEANPWWMPDTLWSPKRLFMVYAKRNDWYLRDTNGQIVTDGIHYLINWTADCPVGTFGSSKGLRASQWIASVALPAIALSGRGPLPPWSWDSHDSYNGIMFEILADCLGSYGWQNYQYADPDRDGVAEGVTHSCSMGGANDPLSVLFRAENEEFYARLTAAFPEEFAFTINENTSPVGPWWRTRLSGMKFENWMRGCCPNWGDWWDWFYGITPPGQLDTNWGAGYFWAEASFDKPVEDRLKGWDLSYIVTWKERNKAPAENLRQMRFGLGTTMLGDGYFDYSYDDRHPQWQPEFDWDFGLPLADFAKELHGADTLYVRTFSKGMVEVNPYNHKVNGVSVHDSRFTFWLPVQDLAARTVAADTIRVTWTAPDGQHNEADSYDLRYATFPLTIENWDQATAYEGNPVYALPGAPVSVDIAAVPPGGTYYLAVRTTTQGRPEPILSNSAQVQTENIADTTDPDTIDDLHATSLTSTSITLGWTAVGDDGATGTATRTLMRVLAGDTIRTESDWDRASIVEGLGDPLPAGSAESFRIHGLSAATTYGIAARAEDDAANLSPLPAPLLVRTLDTPPPPPADHTAPAAINDAAGETGATGSIVVRWSAPGDDGWEGRAASYLVRVLRGRAIASETDWFAATVPTNTPPEPADPHVAQSMTVTGLTAGATYGVAIRAVDDAGNVAALSNSLLLTAGAAVPPPADDVPPGTIDDLAASAVTESTAVLSWTPTGDDGDQGTASSVEVGILVGRGILTEADWQGATRWTIGGSLAVGVKGLQTTTATDLLADTIYGAAARARDEAGNLGALGPAVTFRTEAPPPPPPPPPAQPPAAILDLRLLAAGTDTAVVAWTAPGDDGTSGRATRYLARIREGEDIATESDWLAASPADTSGLGRPAPAGSGQIWTLRGLTPGARYALAVRAEDDSSLVGALSNPFGFETTTPPPPIDDRPEPVTDLSSLSHGETWIDISWTAPAVSPGGGAATRYFLATSTSFGPIDSEEQWLAAVPRTEGVPAPAVPGTAQSMRIDGLEAATAYAIALRAEDADGDLGGLAASILVTTDAPPDTSIDPPPPPPPPVDRPPAPIRDLTASEADTSSVLLRWTAVGEDSLVGTAAHYQLRLLTGGPIASEENWTSAAPVTAGLPVPGPAGAVETMRLEGLTPGTVYGVALRAADAAGQISSLVPGPVVTTPLPPPPDDPVAPVAVDDLAAIEVTVSGALVHWSHPTPPDDPGAVVRYVVKIASAPISEADWEAASEHPSPPAPAGAGVVVSVSWTGLEEGTTYWTSVRGVSGDGLWSPIASVSFTTATTPDLAPPAIPAGLRVAGTDGQGRVRLEWDASGDPDLEGYRIYARTEGGGWTGLLPDMLPADATSVAVEAPSGTEFAITAVDRSGNESALSAPVSVLASRGFALRGPFPHPVTDACRFEVDLPAQTPANNLVLRILDSTGREVRRITGGEAGDPGTAVIAWDRRDATGHVAAPGFYLAIVEAGGRKITRRIFASP
jgi:hypothetical protein